MEHTARIIRVIKSRRMRWTGPVTNMGKMRNAYKTVIGKHEGKRACRRSTCTGRKIILEWILGK